MLARKKLAWTNVLIIGKNSSGEGCWSMPWFLEISTNRKAHYFLFWMLWRFQQFGPTSWSPACLNHKEVAQPGERMGFLRNSSPCPKSHKDEGNHWPPGGGSESLAVSNKCYWENNLDLDPQCGQVSRRCSTHGPTAELRTGGVKSGHRPGPGIGSSHLHTSVSPFFPRYGNGSNEWPRLYLVLRISNLRSCLPWVG
jgi:hypothetical protein